MRYCLAVLIALFGAMPLAHAQSSCPTPTVADAGKFCVANADGTADWRDYIAYDPVQDRLVTKKSTRCVWQGGAPIYTNQFPKYCFEGPNNQPFLAQLDTWGLPQNVYMLDDQQNYTLGPLWDGGVNSQLTWTLAPSFDIDHVRWNVTGGGIPAGLAVTPQGNGYVGAASSNRDLSYLFAQKSVADGDGVLLVPDNIQTNLFYGSDTRFMLSVSSTPCLNLQFGLETLDRSSGLEFVMKAPHCPLQAGESVVMACTIWNPTYPDGHTVTSTWNRFPGRQSFQLFIPRPRSPHSSGDQIVFRAGGVDLQLGDICAFARDDAAMPGDSVTLVPFILFKSMLASQPRTLWLWKWEIMR